MTVQATRRTVLAASIAFLATGCRLPWTGRASFGSKIRTKHSVEDVSRAASPKTEPIYVPEARTYLVPYPSDALDKAEQAYPPAQVSGLRLGVIALHQKCTHLGCKVPWCNSSQWFECPCHAALFNRVGERKAGPAPRGLNGFPVALRGGLIEIDTGSLLIGRPDGTNTTGQEAEGPHCIG